MISSAAFYRRAKWAGLAVSLIVLGLYIASYAHEFYWGESNDYKALARGQIGHYTEHENREDGRLIEYFGPHPRWEIPLGWCFLGIAIATAWLWYQARSRVEAGHCSCCGYSLTGNISGICPECGTPAKRAESQGNQDRPSAT